MKGRFAPVNVVKADLKPELETWILDCRDCSRAVHRVVGLGVTPGHWAHQSPRRTASLSYLESARETTHSRWVAA